MLDKEQKYWTFIILFSIFGKKRIDLVKQIDKITIPQKNNNIILNSILSWKIKILTFESLL